MEHTGLIMTPPAGWVVTHELAHEWWYALVSERPGAGALARRGVRHLRRGGGGLAAAALVPPAGAGARLVTRGTAYFRGRRAAATG